MALTTRCLDCKRRTRGSRCERCTRRRDDQRNRAPAQQARLATTCGQRHRVTSATPIAASTAVPPTISRSTTSSLWRAPARLGWAAEDFEIKRGHFEGNVRWLAGVLAAREYPSERLARDLEIAAEVVGEGSDARRRLAEKLRRGARVVRRA